MSSREYHLRNNDYTRDDYEIANEWSKEQAHSAKLMGINPERSEYLFVKISRNEFF